VLDTGLNYPPSQAAWQAAFAELGIGPSSITRIILTHSHPDHYGSAGWLAAQSGAPVLISPIEEEFAQKVWYGEPTAYRSVVELFYAHGMPAELSEVVYDDMVALRPMTQPLPQTTLLEPGTRLRIGARVFEAITTPGHSDGHLVFYCAEERLLLCGDVVLVKITPNISLWPYGRPDPLADFLQSLDYLAGLDVALALPGHGPLIDLFRQRLDELHAHHDGRLRAIERVVGGGATAFDVCRAVFPSDQLSPHQFRFAMAETLAHLEYLVGKGQLVRVRQEPLIYRKT
jgi:glyoxylase-like metal-dependent hydrolase (beta-lactamase superfamily II)